MSQKAESESIKTDSEPLRRWFEDAVVVCLWAVLPDRLTLKELIGSITSSIRDKLHDDGNVGYHVLGALTGLGRGDDPPRPLGFGECDGLDRFGAVNVTPDHLPVRPRRLGSRSEVEERYKLCRGYEYRIRAIRTRYGVDLRKAASVAVNLRKLAKAFPTEKPGGEADLDVPTLGEITLAQAAGIHDVPKTEWTRATQRKSKYGYLPHRRIGRNVYVTRRDAKAFADAYSAKREQRAVGTRSSDPDRDLVVSALQKSKKNPACRQARK